MPRSVRRQSKTDIYHVMLRGINRQNVFEDEEDNLKFLDILGECKVRSGFKLFTYCLMGNHIHLLIKEEKEPLELIFQPYHPKSRARISGACMKRDAPYANFPGLPALIKRIEKMLSQ